MGRRGKSARPVAGKAASERNGRSKTQEVLQHGDEYYRLLTESALDVIVVLNADKTVRYMSPAFERMAGKDRSGRNPFEFVHPDDMQRATEAFSLLLRSPGDTVHVEMRGQHRDGSWRDFEVVARNLIENPRVEGIVVNFRDVSERKCAEEALRESEKRLREIFNNVTDEILISDATGTIVDVNERCWDLFGYRPEDVIGRNFADLGIFDPDEVARMAGLISESLASGDSTPAIVETQVRHRGGHYVPLEVSTRPIWTADGEFEYFVNVVRDITRRKQTEEALRESERRFREIFNNITDEILISDGTGTIINVNERCWDLSGYRPEEVIGRDFADLGIFDPDELSRMTELIAAALADGSPTQTVVETNVKHKDGHYVPLEVSTRPVRTADGEFEYFVNIIRDITERKRAEEALRQAHDELEARVEQRTADLAKANEELQTEIAERRRAEETLKESELRYRLLAENVTDVITSTDLDLKPTFMSPSITHLLGYTVEEAMSRTMEESLTPASRELAVEKLALQLEAEQAGRQRGPASRGTEFEFYRKDGSTVWVDISVNMLRDSNGNPIGLVNLLRDVTERRRADEALRESEEHYAALVENLTDGVFKFKDGLVVWCNDRVEETYGYPKDELIGKDASFFLPQDVDSSEYVKAAYPEIKDRGHFSDAARVKKKDGTWADIEYSISMIPGKYPIELVAVARDITARREAEREKLRMEQQILLTGRLAAVGELAAGVAHELNNPLAAVQAFSQFLVTNRELDEATRSDVETIYREAQRASRITANLLSFARRHRPEKRLTSINEVVQESLGLHTYHMKVNNIDVVTDLDPDLPMTMADFHQLQQVFVNLMTNAEQALTEAGVEGRLIVATQRVRELIQVTFEDNGPGIPEEDLKRVFDPFFTTKEVGKGSGLGLSICYGIVEEHGGRLYAKSKAGKGATFIVEIPIVSEGQATPGSSDLEQGRSGHDGGEASYAQ